MERKIAVRHGHLLRRKALADKGMPEILARPKSALLMGWAMPSFQGILVARIELAEKYSEKKHPQTQEEEKAGLRNCLNNRH